ncbi:hypothetical protein Tco_1166138 [Tanacetum coccineum]
MITCLTCYENLDRENQPPNDIVVRSLAFKKDDKSSNLARWWNLDVQPYESYDGWLSWFKSIRFGSKTKDVLEGVFYVSWWSIWYFRNQLLFSDSIPRKDAIFDDIILRSFNWCVARSSKVLNWVFSTWMAFGGNTRDLGSFGEETDEITDLHQILEEVLLTERGDGVASIKRRRRDLSGDGVWTLATASQQDLALYENESWNDPRDFAKPVKAIALPQDVPSTSDRRLIELENQVQRLMEAHLAPTQPTQVNKVTTSCEICSGPHDTQYCMKDPEQAFVEYASSHTDEAEEGLVSNFMASQDARLSKFESDFKQQQSEMTNKIDTVLKAITDRIAGALPSDTVKNPKLSTSLVLSARSYPIIDTQCSSHPSTLINAIKAHSKEANISQTSLLRPGMEIETQQPEEPEPTLKDEF